jgi:hypothetical protein
MTPGMGSGQGQTTNGAVVTPHNESRPGIGTEAANEDLTRALLTTIPERDTGDAVDTDEFTGPEGPPLTCCRAPGRRLGAGALAFLRPRLRRRLRRRLAGRGNESARSWTAAMRAIKDVLRLPTHEERRRRRGETA